jgi:thioredoxin reductase
MNRRHFLQICGAAALAPRHPFNTKLSFMKDISAFEAIIVGGSFAGLSAALALGRSMRQVLVIDGGKPCNWQVPQAHNLVTHDGANPREIARLAHQQVANYPTITFRKGLAVAAEQIEGGFTVKTDEGAVFRTRKLLFATGVLDLMPTDIQGFTDCWGISIAQCPYCHGYEVRDLPTGVMANGDWIFDFLKTIRHWTPRLSLFTNGPSALTEPVLAQLQRRHIQVVETPLKALHHQNGHLQMAEMTDGTTVEIRALYTKLPFRQHCSIPVELGCNTTEDGLIQVDFLQKTSVAGVFAAGDATTPMRALSVAIAAGTTAGAVLNRELIEEEW